MKIAIVSFPGSANDLDMLHAVKNIAQADADIVFHNQAELSAYDALILPAGASYGDYLRPGALALSSPVIKQVQAFAQSGKPVLCVGNGFQIAVEAGLLPGAFLRNPSLKFRSGRAKVKVEQNGTLFTDGYEAGQVIELPYAHMYGSYYTDEKTAAELEETGRIVFRYTDNTDHSTNGIAGVLNERGNVLGMMPLAERAVEQIIGGTDGLPLFQSIVKNGSEQNVSKA